MSIKKYLKNCIVRCIFILTFVTFFQISMHHLMEYDFAPFSYMRDMYTNYYRTYDLGNNLRRPYPSSFSGLIDDILPSLIAPISFGAIGPFSRKCMAFYSIMHGLLLGTLLHTYPYWVNYQIKWIEDNTASPYRLPINVFLSTTAMSWMILYCYYCAYKKHNESNCQCATDGLSASASSSVKDSRSDASQSGPGEKGQPQKPGEPGESGKQR